MKTFVAIALIIFGAFMSYVFIGGFLQKQDNEEPAQTKVENTDQTTPSTDMQTQIQTTGKSYTIAEVSAKNTRDSCWLIINNKVYDVSKFISEHPGGSSAIVPYCGKEASKAFETQDRGSNGGHSSNAQKMLSEYEIGSLKN